MRRLAEAAGTTASTISAMVFGTRDTKGDVIERVATALKMADRADQVTKWAGRARSEPRAFKAHQDANLLTAEEQSAVNELIRLLALPKKRGEGRADTGPTPTKTPAPSPAEQLGKDDVTLAAAEGDRDPRDEAEETERST